MIAINIILNKEMAKTMKIGIVIHSKTGNTLSVAQKAKQELLKAGHSVTVEQVTSVDEEAAAQGKVQLKNIPDVSSYDAVIFGAPVHAFSLSQVMKEYLSKTPSLSDKKVSCFVTQQFPYAWMGGNRAVGQMRKACEAKGTSVLVAGIVNWSHKQRETRISDMVKKLTVNL